MSTGGPPDLEAWHAAKQEEAADPSKRRKYHLGWSRDLIPTGSLPWDDDDTGGAVAEVHSRDVPRRLSGWWIEPLPALPDDWVSATRIEPDRYGTPQVVEVRCFPAAWLESGPAGAWGLFETAPHDIVPAKASELREGILTKTRIEEAKTIVRQYVAEHPDTFPDRATLEMEWSSEARGEAPQHPGRSGRTDDYWLTVALAYVRCLADDPERVAVCVAAELSKLWSRKVTPKQATAYINRTRKKGFLTPAPGRGKAGGELTDKARQLLTEGPD
jgi:hypothetical protein